MRVLLYSLFFLVFCGNSLVAQNYYYSLEEPQEMVPQNATEINNVNELIAGLKSNSNLYLKAGDYVLPQTLFLKDISNLTVTGADGAVIKGNLIALIKFRGNAKNISFKNVTFNSTSASKAEHGGGIVYFDHASAENILFENCSFTCPKLNANGLKFVSEGSARSKNIKILRCHFYDIGRMAFETQNHNGDGIVRLNRVTVTECDFNSLGLQSPHGMAISLSGAGQDATLSKNTIVDAKNIGIELVGWEDVLILENTFSASKSEYQPFSIQKSPDPKEYLKNIKVIGNSGYSNIDNGGDHNLGFSNLDGLVYSDNTFDADFIGLFNVKNSTITNNVHTAHGNSVIAFFDQCRDNLIKGNTFKSTKNRGNGIVLYSGMTGNKFTNTTVILNDDGGKAYNDYNEKGSNENINMTVKYSN